MDFLMFESGLKRYPSFEYIEEDGNVPFRAGGASLGQTHNSVNNGHPYKSNASSFLRRNPSMNQLMPAKKSKISSSSSSALYADDDADSLDSSLVSEIYEYFSSSSSTDDESNSLSVSDVDERNLINDAAEKEVVPMEELISQPNLEMEVALRCPNHHGKIAVPWNVHSRVVARLDDIIAVRHDRMMITSATDLFHVEWCNAAWSQFTGWSSDEVLGLSCSFLQGIGTDKSVLSAFSEMLELSGGFADMTIVNYTKYHTVVRNTIHCFPITDNCGFGNTTTITHIGTVLLESQEVLNPNFCDELVRRNPDLQFDRRNQSECFALMNTIPAPNPMEWINLTKDFTISLMLRYVMRSCAPILIVDGDGHVVHANKAWVDMTHLRHVEVESVPILKLMGPKSRSSELRKLESAFRPEDNPFNFEFKRPISPSSLCQVEVQLKRRTGPLRDAFADFVFKTPAQLKEEKALIRAQGLEPDCAFCKIYDDNAEKMAQITDTMPVYATVSRFNSEHVAILFNEQYIV